MTQEELLLELHQRPREFGKRVNAYHEAGHAVALSTIGVPITRVTLERTSGYEKG
jgi:hypothetical protein